jgi:hypothetical protein
MGHPARKVKVRHFGVAQRRRKLFSLAVRFFP